MIAIFSLCFGGYIFNNFQKHLVDVIYERMHNVKSTDQINESENNKKEHLKKILDKLI